MQTIPMIRIANDMMIATIIIRTRTISEENPEMEFIFCETIADEYMTDQ